MRLKWSSRARASRRFGVTSMASTAACKERARIFTSVAIARSRNRCFLAIFILSAFILPIAAGTAYAHGEHGDAAPPEGGVSLVSFAGFQAELLTSPRPPRVGEETKIVINILRNGSKEPVRNGQVLMGIAPSALGANATARPGAPAERSLPSDIALVPVREETWAGNYTLTKTFEHEGQHVVRVQMSKLGETIFEPPQLLEFRLNIAPAAGLSPGLIALFLSAAAIALAGMIWGVLRVRAGPRSDVPVNLLTIPWLQRFVIWKGFQPVLQIPVLLFTVGIMLVGFFDIQDGAKNLATKLTWI